MPGTGDVQDVHLFFRGDPILRTVPFCRDGIIQVQDMSILRVPLAAQTKARLVYQKKRALNTKLI